MHRVRRFLGLGWRERLFLIQTLVLLGAVRLGLWLLPFRRVLDLLSRLSCGRDDLDLAHRLSVQQIAWAVKAGSRYIPRATCLTQALAGRVLLARQGYPAHLHIGVAKGAESGLVAHAWLTSDDKVVIGDQANLDRLALFPPIQ